MLIDRQLELSRAQAVTATAVSTDVIDTQNVRDLGAGRPLYLYVQVDETATAAGAATVTFELVTDDNAAFSSAVVLWTSAAIGKVELVAGVFEIKQALPIGVAYEKFLAVRYTVATGPLTAGKFTAAIVADVPTDKSYPRNYEV